MAADRMHGRTAELILLAACVLIALLLLTESVSTEEGAAGFAVALVVLGLASRGFRS